MRSRKAFGVLCYGMAVYLLAISSTLASTETLPPAIAMLKNLKKNSSANVTPPKPVVHQTKSAKPVVPKSKAVQPAIETSVQKHDEKQLADNNVETTPVTILPEHIQFDKHAIAKRQEEVEKELTLAKAKEEAQAFEEAKYYVDHEHEIKLREIGDALSNRKPAFQPGTDKSANVLATPVITNVYPVKNVKIAYKERHKTMVGKVKLTDTTNKHQVSSKPQRVHHGVSASTISRAAAREPVSPSRLGWHEEVTIGPSDSSSPLPEGAELVAGNPYNDEFFIVTDDSPKELKELADNAKNKDYIPPVVLAASEKQSSTHAVSTLIKKVTTQVAHTAKYVSDPIIQYMTTKKIASANIKPDVADKKVVIAKSENTTSLSKPKFAAEKIATKVFNSKLSRQQETEEVDKIVKQLQAKNTKKSDIKNLANKKVKNKIVAAGKAASKQKQTLVERKSVKPYQPVVKNYAQMVKIKNHSRQGQAAKSGSKTEIARRQPMAVAEIDADDFNKTKSKSTVKSRIARTENRISASMHAEVKKKKKQVLPPEEEDLMNEAF